MGVEEGEEVFRKKGHMEVSGDTWLYASCLKNCANWRCLRYQSPSSITTTPFK